jgi:hypothetical protein
LAVSGGILFAGTAGDGVFRSTNSGASWAQIDVGLTNPVVHALTLSGSRLFAGTDSGIFRSTNSGGSWTRADSGLTNLHVTSFAVFRTNLFAGTDPGGIFLSTDAGTSWTEVDSGLTHPYVSALTVSGATLYAGLREGGIWRRPLYEMILAGTYPVRLAEGWNMVSVPALVTDFSQAALFPTSASNCFAYERGYVRSDTLRNVRGYWIKVNDTVTTVLTGYSITEDSVNLNSGWNIIGSISEPMAVGSIVSMPGGVITSQFFGYAGTYAIADSLTPGNAYWVKVNQDCVLYLSSTSAPPNASASIRILPTREAPPPSPDIREVALEAPRQYALAQNYPNPFNPTTEIGFSLPERTYVTIRIFNSLGQIVGRLVDGERDAGTYVTRWNAEQYPSGVYMYQLRAGRFAESRKMLLIR